MLSWTGEHDLCHAVQLLQYEQYSTHLSLYSRTVEDCGGGHGYVIVRTRQSSSDPCSRLLCGGVLPLRGSGPAHAKALAYILAAGKGDVHDGVSRCVLGPPTEVMQGVQILARMKRRGELA